MKIFVWTPSPEIWKSGCGAMNHYGENRSESCSRDVEGQGRGESQELRDCKKVGSYVPHMLGRINPLRGPEAHQGRGAPFQFNKCLTD